jgi:electron transfer flavoprotein-quinone oxidoreductase
MPKPIFEKVKDAVSAGQWNAKMAASFGFQYISSEHIKDEVYEAIVLGAGPASFGFVKQIIDSKTIKPNKENQPIIVLEACEKIGVKSVYGGAFWPNDPTLFEKEPNFFDDCPFDRKVVKKNDNMHLVTQSGKVFTPPIEAATIFRNSSTGYITPKNVLYPYFWSKLEKYREEGYFKIRSGQAADVLILNEKGSVVGVSTFTGQKYFGKVVIDGTGCGATFSKNLSARPLNNHQGDFFFGVKLIVKMENDVINKAFGLKNNQEGSVLELAGNISKKIKALPGIVGIYPGNGIVNVSILYSSTFGYKSGLQPHEVMNEVLQHPMVKKVTQGSKPLEWSACRLPELHFKFMPSLTHDGYIPIGDSIGLVDFLRKHGVNIAIKSGAVAADTVAKAKRENKAMLQETLRNYDSSLKQSWVGKRLMSSSFKFIHHIIHMPIFYKVMVWHAQLGFKMKGDYTGLAPMTHSEYMALNGEAEGQPEIIIKDTTICASCPTEACLTSDPCQAFAMNSSGIPVLDIDPVMRDVIKAQQKRLSVFKMINAEGCLECGNCESACPEGNVIYSVPGNQKGKHGKKNKGIIYKYN